MTTHSVSGVKSAPYIVSEAMKRKARGVITSRSATTAHVIDTLGSLTLSSTPPKTSITSQVIVSSLSQKYTKDATSSKLLALSKKQEYAWILAEVYRLKDKKILGECDEFFQTALHIIASQKGKEGVFDSYKYEAIGKLIEIILEYNEELISTRDSRGDTPIAIACKCNNREVVRAFAEKLKKRAHLFICDEIGEKESALATACIMGHTELVKEITTHVEDLRGIFEQRDRKAKLPLMQRVASGEIVLPSSILDQLLTASKDHKVNIFAEDSHRMNVLDYACKAQNTSFLKVFSNFFFSIPKYPSLGKLRMVSHISTLKEAENSEGLEHYIRAFWNSISVCKDYHILKAMLNAAYELKVRSAIDYVHMVSSQNLRIVFSDEMGWTPLHEAGEYGDVEALKLYRKAVKDQYCWTFSKTTFGSHVFYRKDNVGDTPFHKAAKNNHVEFAKIYLSYDDRQFITQALPENDKKETPLHYFARHSDCRGIEACEERIEWATNPFLAKDSEGNTPFTIAIEWKNHLLVKKYLEWFKGRETDILPIIDNPQELQVLLSYAADQKLTELEAVLKAVFEKMYHINEDDLHILGMAKKGEWKSVSQAVKKYAPHPDKVAFMQLLLALATEAENDEMVVQLVPYIPIQLFSDDYKPISVAIKSRNPSLVKKYMDWMKRDLSSWFTAKREKNIEKAMEALSGVEELLFILDTEFNPLVLAIKNPIIAKKLLTIAKERKVALFNIEGLMDNFCKKAMEEDPSVTSTSLLGTCFEQFKQEGKQCFINTGVYEKYFLQAVISRNISVLKDIKACGYNVYTVENRSLLDHAFICRDQPLFDFSISLPKVDMGLVHSIFRDAQIPFVDSILECWKTTPERFVLPDEFGKSILQTIAEKRDEVLLKNVLSIVFRLKRLPEDIPLSPASIALKFGFEEFLSDVDEDTLTRVDKRGESLLQLAFMRGKFRFIGDTLTKYPTLFLKQLPDEKTVLHYAAACSNSAIVEKCIAVAHDRLEVLSLQDADGNTALHLAPNSDLANSLIEKLGTAPAHLMKRNKKNESCLFTFCRKGLKSSIHRMLSVIPKPLDLIKEISSDLDSQIIVAAKNSNYEIVKIYLEKLAGDLGFLSHQDATGATLFHYLKSQELAIYCITLFKEHPELILKSNESGITCLRYWSMNKMYKAIAYAEEVFKGNPLLNL